MTATTRTPSNTTSFDDVKRLISGQLVGWVIVAGMAAAVLCCMGAYLAGRGML